ncbi:MAG: glycosyltransferase family 2 protein [Oscillospiraceae bacterium]|jgi:glycosyltransferase involved in cell wall biosynthesis
MNETISIIVPIYNCGEYLRECIDSIIGQTYEDLEIILVDDGSTDHSPEICDEYAKRDGRIRVIHKPNGGVSSARNAGIMEAAGRYIQFVDGDDYIERNMSQILAESIRGFDIAICGYKMLTGGKTIHYSFANKQYETPAQLSDDLERLLETNHLHASWNKLFRRELIRNSYNEKMDMGEDIDFCLNYLSGCKRINIIADCLYNYRKMENSLTTKYRDDYYEIEKKLYRLVDRFCRENIKDEFCEQASSFFVKNTYYIFQKIIRQQKTFDKSRGKIQAILDDGVFKSVINRLSIRGLKYSPVIAMARRRNVKAIFFFFKLKTALIKLR